MWHRPWGAGRAGSPPFTSSPSYTINCREQRERQRAEREAREAEEAKVRALEEEAKRQEDEATQRQGDVLQRAQALVDDLGAEPTEKPFTVIRFQLPNGTRFTRKFAPSTTFESVRAFIVVQLAERESTIQHFNLFLAAKRQSFTAADNSTTLQDAGLRADTLLIQDLDA